MAKIEDIERRLLNWVRWRGGVSSGGLGYTRVTLMGAHAGRGGGYEAKVPAMDLEAEETDRGVLALPSHLRATVEAVYLGVGTMREKAGRLRRSEATLYAGVVLAHRRLSIWLSRDKGKGRDSQLGKAWSNT